MDVSTLIGGLQVVTIVGILVVIVNIITEVLKQFTWATVHTNIVATTVSMIVTVISLLAYWQINGIAIYWYSTVGAVFMGLFVAYAAMYGFDKFKEAFSGASSSSDT